MARKLTPAERLDIAVAAYLAGASVAEAARKARITRIMARFELRRRGVMRSLADPNAVGREVRKRKLLAKRNAYRPPEGGVYSYGARSKARAWSSDKVLDD